MARRLLARRTGCRRWCERSSSDVFELRRDHYASTACASKNLKVAIVGATGQTGRSLALCLKQSALIDELAVYDTYPTRGLLLELSHMDSRCRTIVEDESADCAATDGYFANVKRDLERALTGAKVVAITLDRDENLREQAEYLEKIVSSLVGCCPKAFVALVSRKVNSLVPMLYELYKKAGLFDASSRIFGVVNLFSTRANSFAAEQLKIQPEYVSVPVIGGACSRTCVPLFSQSKPCADFTSEELSRLRHAMKSAEAAESSSLCLGFAAARFCISLCKALRAESGLTESAYVRSCLLPELKYFAAPLELGPNGLQRQLGVPRISSAECDQLYLALPKIQRDIELGESLALGLKESTELCPVPARCCRALQPGWIINRAD